MCSELIPSLVEGATTATVGVMDGRVLDSGVGDGGVVTSVVLSVTRVEGCLTIEPSSRDHRLDLGLISSTAGLLSLREARFVLAGRCPSVRFSLEERPLAGARGGGRESSASPQDPLSVGLGKRLQMPLTGITPTSPLFPKPRMLIGPRN